MIHIIFCDDNDQFLSSIKILVQRVCSMYVPQQEGYTIGRAFGNGLEVLEYIRKTHVDVLFLDIDMPDLDGFEVARILCKEYPRVKIVFMSAYDNFVYSTFDYYPFAYLRKKYIAEELPKVIKRIMDKIHEEEAQLSVITKQGIKIINVTSIMYIESCRNYSKIHSIGGQKYICRGSLSSFEEKLNEQNFYRIHSAYLVNLSYVEKIINSTCVLVKTDELPVAQKRSQEFRKAYMTYMRGNFNS